MPTNCKGQDKPRQSRGYQVAKDRDRGARGSPGRGGRGAGGEGLHHLPVPACPQAGSRAQQPKLGTPAAHRSSASPRFTPRCVCMGVTSSSRMAAMFGGVGVAVATAKQSLVSWRAAAKAALVCQRGSCPPSLVPPQPAPEGTTAMPLCSPRPQNPFASTLSWFPSTVERINPEADDPRAPGAIELRAASTAGMLRFSPPMFKHEAVLLNVAIWAALVPRKESRPGEDCRAVLPFGISQNPDGRSLLPFGHTERGEPAGAREGVPNPG